jgi:predicted PurR-regulated permease PerM
MTLGIFINLLLLFIFVPIAYGLLWAAKRCLAVTNPFRRFLEKHGVDRVARYSLFAVYALGATLLTFLYS